MRKRILHTLCAAPEWLLVTLAWIVVPRLSRRRIVRLAARSGNAMARICGRPRRIVEANLDLVFGPAAARGERDALVRAIFAHAVLVLLDFFWFARDSRNRVLQHVAFDAGIERVIASDDPAIMVTGHVGAWELAAQVLCARGRRLTSVYAPLGGPQTRERMRAMRKANGQTVVPREGAAVALLRALHERQLIGLLLDQFTPVSSGGVFVDFLGRKAIISKIAGTLSVRRHVPVHILWCRHLGDGEYRAELLDTLPAGHGMDEVAVTQWAAAALGAAVRGAPEQWLWTYRRWRHVPLDEDPKDYPFYARPFNPLCN
jgi:KDO2-lipid IV(A) lauroyltransferase